MRAGSGTTSSREAPGACRNRPYVVIRMPGPAFFISSLAVTSTLFFESFKSFAATPPGTWAPAMSVPSLPHARRPLLRNSRLRRDGGCDGAWIECTLGVVGPQVQHQSRPGGGGFFQLPKAGLADGITPQVQLGHRSVPFNRRQQEEGCIIPDVVLPQVELSEAPAGRDPLVKIAFKLC